MRKIKPAWDRYQDSLKYQDRMGLRTKAPKWVKMFEGDQWPAAGELTKNMPRPVVNIIKMIARNKKAGVLSSPVSLHFDTDNEAADTEKFDRFAEYINREMEQDERDSEAIGDKIKKGTCVWHYYWDSSVAGKRGNIDGGLSVETIDFLNVHVPNPNEKDEQKQKWIMISSREELENVLENTEEKYKMNVAEVQSDSSYHEVENDNEKYLTVLTEYFRDESGQVFWQKHTKSGPITDPVSMTPGEEKPEGEQEAVDGTPDKPKVNKTPKRVFERYPVVIGVWDERDKSYCGIGEVESLEHNQKAINLGIALQLLKVQNEAFGKWIVSEDALEGQEITNDISQTLIDHSKLGNGIRKAQETPISGMPMNIITGLLDQTRMVSGATEVMSGEVIGAGMSGAAIATLQAQALKPIEEKQKSFWRDKQRQGLIIAEFFKFYYEGRPFVYTEKDDEGKEKAVKDVFNGSEYADSDFRVIVQAGAATTFSEGGDIAMLETLAGKGLITPRTMVEAYPKNALSNKKEILEAFDRQEQSQMAQMEMQLQKATDQLTKATEIIKQQTQVIDKAATLVQENERLKATIIQLGAEFTEKIGMAQQQIAQVNSDAATYAKIIAEKAGIGGIGMPPQGIKQ